MYDRKLRKVTTQSVIQLKAYQSLVPTSNTSFPTGFSPIDMSIYT